MGGVLESSNANKDIIEELDIIQFLLDAEGLTRENAFREEAVHASAMDGRAANLATSRVEPKR
jgi:hypothetical protein